MDKKSMLPQDDPVFWIMLAVILIILVSILLGAYTQANAAQVKASWYSRESCKAEQVKYYGKVKSLKMANGKELNDESFTCASWDYPFGTRVMVRNCGNGRSVIVTVTDRGPAKRCVKKGVVIDLSKAAFMMIAELRQGVVEVDIKKLEDDNEY